MRTLSILRHAKSSWDDERLSDFDRPLAPRGRKAAPKMGRHMRSIALKPDLVLCSPAVRTRETAELALAEFGAVRPPISFEGEIYEATADALVARLRRVADPISHVLLIGHNPGLQDLVMWLAGEHLEGSHARLAEKLPTGALVVIELETVSWGRLAPGMGRVTHFQRPRDL